MKSSNKITMVIIISALSVFMLAACGSNGNGADVTGETTATTVPAGGEVSSQAGQDIGTEKVQDIVLAKVPGATDADIYELEKDYDDGLLEYEGSIYYNGYEYEFEVDGATGNILKWEIDD